MAKKNLKLLVILIILAGGAYLLTGPIKNWDEKKRAPKNFLVAIDINLAERIEIARKEKTVKLVKEGEGWRVEGEGKFFADPEAIKTLKTEFKKAQSASLEIASANKNKKSDFDLDKEYGTEIKFYQGGNEFGNFLIGKMTSDYSGVYIGKEGDDNSYAVPIRLSAAFSPYEWRDRMILSLDKNKLERIRFHYPDREFVLEKKDGKWKGTAPAAFDANEEKLEPVLIALANLRAEVIPAQDFKGTDLEKNLIIVEYKGEGIEGALMVGKDNSQGQYYAKRSDSDNIYLIAKSERDMFNKKMEDLK
ncbi:MAG: DUF4340 domain-containing protein [Patescibacteria group bacterium]|jgi:hypothetical protein